MIFILIDSCALRDLIDNHGYSQYLSEIESLISENRLSFITHKLVVEEWEKHKKRWKKDKEKKLLGYSKQESNLNADNNAIIPFTNISADHIEIQITQIDMLLASAKVTLETPDIISRDFSNRFRNGLAPFHKKKDSQNDWEIFGSFCNYCETRGIKELYFLSSNHTDFGDENNSFETIHPDLKERFSKIVIHYFKNYRKFFEQIRNLHSISLELIPYTIVPNKRYSYKTTIRKTVLESLLYLFNDLYSEINFIPVHILKKYYPFASSEDSNPYYSKFTMSYVSENLIQFFETIKVKDGKEIQLEDELLFIEASDYKEKIYIILKKLTQNLVFHLVGEKSNKKVCTHYHEPVKCDCFRCSFTRFEFHKSFQTVRENIDDYKECLKQAYIHCQLGNFRSASKIYDNIIERALTDKKFITYFIAKYNQRHLSNFIRNPFVNKKVDDKLVEKLALIDKLEEAVKLKTYTDYQLLSFIAEGDFFTDAFQNITEALRNIISHYHSQIKGGWSSNQHIWELIEAFTNLDAFLNSNYIIYDSYSNFEKLFENVVEGIFASYAISKDQNDRFEKFDDYWVSKFILYGNRESIVKLFKRYDLEPIKYESKNIDGDSFLDLSRNFFTSKKELKDSLRNFADEDNDYFERKCSDWFENIVTMASILELTENILSEFAKLLIDYLKDNSKFPHNSMKPLEYFIEQKGKLLAKVLKYEFLNWGIANQNCYIETLYSTLEIFEDNDLTDLSTKAFNNILKQTLNLCAKCGHKHDFLLGTFYNKVDKQGKQLISEKVADLLIKNNDFELSYMAWIYEIVFFEHNKLRSFIEEYKFSKSKVPGHPLLFRKLDFQISKLDKIINLCFKYDVKTTDKSFSQIKDTHLYYQWLLDIENFDYKHFNPEWALLYQTKYYNKAMSKSPILIKALRDSISNRFHVGIERLLLRITNFVKD